MPTLPGELVDFIIDWSHAYSPSSLAAYALVCRQWLPRSRYHHFASIRLVRDRSTDTVKTFLYLIASPLVTFISSIRDVDLYYRSSYGTPVLSAGDIILLLSKSGIRLTRLNLDCHFNQLGMQDSGRIASLTRLQLLLYGEVPLGTLFNYLVAFPSLESWMLAVRTESERGVQSQHRSAEFPPNLHELDV
ncbi:hypothetical protein DFH08DRAFT_460941 [Mycena albidolilacea]|uniref:F-box domain-containing protein n=1 Tax=Mycena albidolilacea TaxID=1033008 RepID=A0AAD7AEF1_9AGAR|nr:hypothetical protein DFH08DRAFT_460941 [Mycena albidolilacea]